MFFDGTDAVHRTMRRVADERFDRMPGRPRRFTHRDTGATFSVLLTGFFPGAIAFPDPAAVAEQRDDLRVLTLPALVELKLAAGRYQDFADVVNLARENAYERRQDEAFPNGPASA